MQKKLYQKELTITGTQQRGGNNKKQDVLKIQSWLTLFDFANPRSGTSTRTNSDFGPATEKAVNNFYVLNNLPATGIIDAEFFELLCAPL